MHACIGAPAWGRAPPAVIYKSPKECRPREWANCKRRFPAEPASLSAKAKKRAEEKTKTKTKAKGNRKFVSPFRTFAQVNTNESNECESAKVPLNILPIFCPFFAHFLFNFFFLLPFYAEGMFHDLQNGLGALCRSPSPIWVFFFFFSPPFSSTCILCSPFVTWNFTHRDAQFFFFPFIPSFQLF